MTTYHPTLCIHVATVQHVSDTVAASPEPFAEIQDAIHVNWYVFNGCPSGNSTMILKLLS